MTYTVKNGTWCKDNEKEYYSTTETGLKAALKAGEITSGTRVVVHNPKYHAGQLIQSLNPECPEGCFVPHGQSFDTSVYEELAKVFPGGKLPDLRECVLVCAGRSERTEITNHDEYTAGQFKDDQFAEHSHNVSSTVTDPGHGHDVTDPGHGHSVSDPGHGHTVTDPGHSHGRGTYEITGKIKYLGEAFNDQAVTSGAFEKEHGYRRSEAAQYAPAPGDYGALNFTASNNWTGRSENVGTGISISSGTTGVSISSGTTGVSISSDTTGITVDTTEEKAGATDKVTHGKQFGVYYYIAF